MTMTEDTASGTMRQPMFEIGNVSKYFGNVVALKDVSLKVYPGEVTCLLGDNGAGKSTLIKILSGVHKADAGEVLFNGERVDLTSPRDARKLGIATVYQDLAMIPLMSIWRNFFLGSEPTSGRGPLRRIDVKGADEIAREQLKHMGIAVRDTSQPVGTLSGGERQSVAIARAIYFGAQVLILDEPTASLGVKQAGVVLRYITQAKARGLGIIFITHNPHHAYPVGDHFVVLRLGRVYGDYKKHEIPLDHLVRLMAGGEDLDKLIHELENLKDEVTSDEDRHQLEQVAQAYEQEFGSSDGT
jgi:simple sugar transport system ATP-binding protein